VNKNKHNIAPMDRLGNNAPANLANYQGTFQMKKTALRASGLVLLLALAAGCASQASLDEVRATAERAAADAAAAASSVETARASADRASQAASAAQSTADQALSASTEAQACCEANRESMERMFQKSMSK
jgi:outer membrane lipoprotein-sorting protein